MDADEQVKDLDLSTFLATASGIEAELHKVIIGQEGLVHDLLVTLLAGGNALLEGVPGLGKTLLVRTLAHVIDCSFSRIQFTPDLMPADIVGTMVLTETAAGHRGFRFEPGPVFANLVLADEVNRAAPRTQSALLEAMQEHEATIAGKSHPMPSPFFVLATQNPIEMEGTYPLPEAQVDRFLYKIDVPYPTEEELVRIALHTTTGSSASLVKVADSARVLAMQSLAMKVPVVEEIVRYVACIVRATHAGDRNATDGVSRHVRLGASPRGAQAVIWAAKVEAILAGRKSVAVQDVRRVAYPALRHRMILNFEAQAEGIPPDSILDKVLAQVQVP